MNPPDTKHTESFNLSILARDMDGPTFRAALERLGFSQVEFARLLGSSRRATQYWLEKGPPRSVACLVHLLLEQGMSTPTPGVLVDPRSAEASDAALSAIEPELSRLLKRAEQAGWPRPLLVSAVAHFVAARILD